MLDDYDVDLHSDSRIAQFALDVSRAYVDSRASRSASPASLVSLYLLFISLAVCAMAVIVSSRPTRWLDAISLLAMAQAVHALTAPNAHRSMHGTCT